MDTADRADAGAGRRSAERSSFAVALTAETVATSR
jgi:hypothetical protein